MEPRLLSTTSFRGSWRRQLTTCLDRPRALRPAQYLLSTGWVGPFHSQARQQWRLLEPGKGPQSSSRRQERPQEYLVPSRAFQEEGFREGECEETLLWVAVDSQLGVAQRWSPELVGSYKTCERWRGLLRPESQLKLLAIP